MFLCVRLINFFVIVLLVVLGDRAWADVSASKANGYVILAPPSDSVSTSKANAYLVLAPPSGSVSTSKVNAYLILAPPSDSVSVAKTVAYAVLASTVQSQPNIFINTKYDSINQDKELYFIFLDNRRTPGSNINKIEASGKSGVPWLLDILPTNPQPPLGEASIDDKSAEAKL